MSLVWLVAFWRLVQGVCDTCTEGRCSMAAEAPERGDSFLQTSHAQHRLAQRGLELGDAEYNRDHLEPLTEEGFNKTNSQCCVHAMDEYIRALLSEMGMEICDEGCHNGFTPFFQCAADKSLADLKAAMIKQSGHVCACYAKSGKCMPWGQECAQGEFNPTWHRRRACLGTTTKASAPASTTEASTTLASTTKASTKLATTTPPATTTTTTTPRATTTVTSTTTSVDCTPLNKGTVCLGAGGGNTALVDCDCNQCRHFLSMAAHRAEQEPIPMVCGVSECFDFAADTGASWTGDSAPGTCIAEHNSNMTSWCKIAVPEGCPAAEYKNVSCGGHDAISCPECGKTSDMCNGECVWVLAHNGGGVCFPDKKFSAQAHSNCGNGQKTKGCQLCSQDTCFPAYDGVHANCQWAVEMDGTEKCHSQSKTYRCGNSSNFAFSNCQGCSFVMGTAFSGPVDGVCVAA